MASFPQSPNGEIDDRVQILFGGIEVRKFEDYSVHTSILQQPAAFSARLSARSGSATILKQIPPGSNFEIRIGSLPQFTGFTDGYEASGTSVSTSVTIKGRNVLAKLYDNDVDADQSLTNVTYEDIVKKAMKEVGLGDRLLQVDNAKNRRVSSGFKVSAIAEPKFAKEVVQSGTGPIVKHVVQAKLGESWLDFIQRHIAKAGLFLWADFEGNIVLSTPNGNQKPTFEWVRQRGRLANRVNVSSAAFRNDTTRRFSEVVIYARSGGRKSGRGKLHGGFEDREMLDLGLSRTRIYRDVNVYTPRQAEAYARRKIAEINRASWFLQYTFSGHTAPTIGGGRAVVIPDVIAHVRDDELGIDENLYIESVEYRSPPQTTMVTMMRLRDLVFGADE